MNINVYFKNQAPLLLKIHNTDSGKQYFNINKKYKNQTPVYIDNKKWTVEYLQQLAKIAKKELGWSWLADSYDLSVTTQLHKDLEYSVGRVGFENIPEEYDWLIYHLHHCLHSVQNVKDDSLRNCPVQIEWLTDDCVPLSRDFQFIENVNFGDVIIINPYVGHSPLQIYMEQDYADLNSTCRFHDIIKPGIVITNYSKQFTKQEILEDFKKNDLDFVNRVGEDKILYYAGSAKIGEVEDKNVLRDIINSEEILELERIEFVENM